MKKYQQFVKNLDYDTPGEGNHGYYALVRDLGIYHCDTHQTVQNDLLMELKDDWEYYVKL